MDVSIVYVNPADGGDDLSFYSRLQQRASQVEGQGSGTRFFLYSFPGWPADPKASAESSALVSATHPAFNADLLIAVLNFQFDSPAIVDGRFHRSVVTYFLERALEIPTMGVAAFQRDRIPESLRLDDVLTRPADEIARRSNSLLRLKEQFDAAHRSFQEMSGRNPRLRVGAYGDIDDLVGKLDDIIANSASEAAPKPVGTQRRPAAVQDAVPDPLEHLDAFKSDMHKLFTFLVSQRGDRLFCDEVRVAPEWASESFSAQVIAPLAERGYLSVSRQTAEDGSVSESVSLSHPALFECWERLRQWTKQFRFGLVLQSEIADDAARWFRGGRRDWDIRVSEGLLAELEGLDPETSAVVMALESNRAYIGAAEHLRQKRNLILSLKGAHLSSALKAIKKGATIGEHDRGDDPHQLRPAFYAAATSNDEPEPGPPQTGDATTDAAARRSVYDDAENMRDSLSRGFTPLRLAAFSGHMNIINDLVERSADIKATGPNDSGPLHDAAYAGHKRVVEQLVEVYGFDPQVKDSAGTPPVLWAIQQRHRDIVDYLLSKGATLEFQTNQGWNPLTEAVRSGDVEFVTTLLDRKIFDVNHATSAGGITPLMVCAMGEWSDGTETEMAKLLIDRGADIARSDDVNARTPIHFAAHMGSPQLLAVLLEDGRGLIDRPDRHGAAPLHLAATRSSMSAARLLLESGASPNVVDDNGTTPLIMAASSGRRELTELLLARGADPSLRRGTAWTALLWAVNDGDIALVRLLADGSPRDALNATTDTGQTALMLAVRMGNLEIIRHLILRGADPGIADDDGMTSLHLAWNGPVTEVLIAHQADVRAVDKGGDTPLHMAALRGDVASTRLLLKAGARPDALNNNLQTPLDLAVRNEQRETAKLLVEAGAKWP
ncbi:MAG: ankyrin repeat domain-containing protein [Rhizomicrobium sp.]